MRKLTAGDYQVMPWKNGGGVTTQLAVFPSGAGLDTFDWRISTAQVASEGPFSVFPGIDRSLAVIQGHGMVLTDADGECCRMGAGSAPFVFRGEQRIDAQLKDGPVVDFNVMTQRSVCSHVLEVTELHGTRHCTPQSDLMLVYVAQGRGTACGMHAGAGETLLVDWREESAIELSAVTPTLLCVAHIAFKEKRND
ncbi:HutD family protein [Noviherbaspirillum sp. ST9]|uniref:HutD/Ves family protein n=1 Tax=Noviherbaspirillum sp. ST9 TaxID=3401606 RepID=UPI003B5889B1